MLLDVSGVVKDFADSRVLDGVTFRMERREKLALVGRNGTGKTTLLRLLTDASEPDRGSVHLARGAHIGYLQQEHTMPPGLTVLQYAETAKEEALALQGRLAELEKLMDGGSSSPELTEEYATLHEHFVEMEGYTAQRDLTAVLGRMGFAPDEYDKPLGKLSGGERTRLSLARLMLEQPDLLILDEPTNHLDLEATEFLEGWVRGYTGAVLLVSHDREFLRRTAERVLHLEDGQVKSYPGGFDQYERLRAEEAERLERLVKKQKAEMDKLDEYVRRFMGSERTAQARGRLKMLRRLEATAVRAPKGARVMSAGFQTGRRSGDIVVDLDRVGMAFSTPLFSDVSWTVRNGERWGVIGENGAGKSTLVRLALGLLSPTQGTVRLGSNVSLAYFAQDLVDLDQSKSPFETLVWDFGMDPAPARDLLGRFLFSGDDVFRPVGTLSGGEKNKLMLAALTTLKPNLLVLDEPTNHLDMASRDALNQVLRSYEGTLIVVSHDRALLAASTDHTLDLRGGRAVLYPGSYAEYRSRQTTPQRTAIAEKPVAQPSLSPRELSKLIEREESHLRSREEAVHEVENALAHLESELASPLEGADLHAMSARHAELTSQLAAAMDAWDRTGQELDALRRQQGAG